VEADWVLFLDADERIDASDAAALREFVDTDALPGIAYGFLVYRMIGDTRRYDQADLWVYRLFSADPPLELPTERLHFVPVPVAISRDRWLRTTLRIQHLASRDATRRNARFAKYELADPDREHQADYSHLLAGPLPELREWRPRLANLPFLAPAAATPSEPLDLDAPVLSAIVISRDDEDRIERSVRSVVEQECPEPFEVIVVTSGTDRTAAIVRERFPDVRLVELDRPALPGEARNAGLWVARGDYVSFPGSHVELPPGSLAARLRAHEQGWAMVTGTTVNGTRTRAGWASYFLDHSSGLPGRPSGELSAPPASCSYMRHLLVEIGGFPEDMRAGEDTVVNGELFGRGHTAFRAAEVTLVHYTRCRTIWRLVCHHFVRGRALGRILLDRRRRDGKLLERERKSLRSYVRRRVSNVSRNVAAWGADGLRSQYQRALPLVVVGAAAASVGTWYELLRPVRGKAALLVGAGAQAEQPERRRDGADTSAGTTLRLSYPTSAENSPRYGYGRPHHARLARLLAAHDATYRLELERLGGLADALVAIPRDPSTPDSPHWLNTWFTGLDAVSLYGFMRLRSPRRYVEVGSGHSTRFAARAKRDGELGTEIISIDRAPRVPIDALCDRTVRAPLELVDLGLFGDLESGDLVLIDGSHRVFMNSDVVTFYLDVLPELPSGVLVGIHDIHWPIDYPPDLRGSYLSEQYLFGALMLGEPSWLQPVLACSYIAQHPELGDVLEPLWNQPQLDGVERQGSLFWFAVER
jgi:glycosyltransferase involved in cell wall biosynthesis